MTRHPAVIGTTRPPHDTGKGLAVVTTTPTRRRRHTGARLRAGLVDPATYRTSLHLMTDFVVGTVTFSVLVSLLATSAGLLVTLVGVPLLLVTLLVARGIGALERRRMSAVLGVEVAAPVHRGRRLLDRLADKGDWRAVLYGLLLFPVGLVTGVATFVGWTTAVAAIASPLFARTMDDPAPHLGDLDLGAPVALGGTVVLGIALLLLMPLVVRMLARLDVVLVRSLLG
jgi:hypothetical protein